MIKNLITLVLSVCLLSLFFSSCKKRQDNHLSSENTKETMQITPDTIVDIYTKTKLELYLDSLGLEEITKACPAIAIDLKYSTTDNFTGEILYKDLNLAYLHPIAIKKLCIAYKFLKDVHPHLNLLVYDAARPLSVQKEMYNAVKDTKYKAYVADPSRTSLHNYGLAVDITICDSIGAPMDMGTGFDYFGKLAGIQDEELFISQKLLTRQQVNNRILLRKIMSDAGFIPIRGEWWHFNAASLAEAQKLALLIK